MWIPIATKINSLFIVSWLSYFRKFPRLLDLQNDARGVARNLFWGYKFLLHNTAVLYTDVIGCN